MMNRGGNVRHPDDYRPRRRRRSRRYRSRRPYRPETGRCCRNSPPSDPGIRLEVNKTHFVVSREVLPHLDEVMCNI